MMFVSLLVDTASAASEPASSSTGSSLLIGFLGVGGLSAIIAAIVTGLFSKRKLGAEATEIITKAASGVVSSVSAELTRSEEGRARDRAEFERDRAEWEHTMTLVRTQFASNMEAVRRVLQLHAAWDAIAIAKYTELAPDSKPLPPAPPLLPPDAGTLDF